jgi:membrane fusion protein (multidrug efflux system)
MKSTLRYGIWAALALTILAGFAYKFIFSGKLSNNSADGDIKNTAAPKTSTSVKVYVVKNENLENKINVIGTLIPNEEVLLNAEIAGKITQIYFQEGMSVSKGQKLVQLNDNELQAQLKRLIVQKELLEQRRKRDEQLRKQDGISEQDLETLYADIRTKEAEIEVTKAQIAKMQLLAPFSGVIGLRNVSEGAFVNTNTAIATLTDQSLLKVDFSIPEKYGNRVAQGTQIQFVVAENPTIYTATVKAVEPKIDAATRTLKIRAVCNNTKNELLAGAYTNITIFLETIKNTYLIPTQALIPEMEAKKVYQVKDGKAVAVKVEIGARTEEKIQILSGLNLGDSVIYSGILQIKPNGAVKILEVN